MADAYGQLLEAAIQHLEELKARGVRFVSVSPQTLADLSNSRLGAVTKVRASPSSQHLEPTRNSFPEAPLAPAPAPPSSPASAVKPLLSQPVLDSAPGLGSPGTAAPPALRLEGEARISTFASFRQRVLPCQKCPNLAASRKNVVFGVGDINASLMFVGEAPGADEDQQGEPFVGKAGQLLTKIIQTMGFTRDSVYIANILKCRPDTPGQSAGNRKPTSEEMQTCLPYLQEQIDLIGPRVIVALGATAVEGLLGKTIGITKLRGSWRTYRGIPLMPTYHPAYLLRNQALSEKRKVWEDMLSVMEKLGRPISEKQRSYFKGNT